MNGYADTGFLGSLYLEETTTKQAQTSLAEQTGALPLIPLGLLEFRNMLNLAVARGRIDFPERDILWRRFEGHMEAGFFQLAAIPAAELHDKARQLSDRYTVRFGTRSLDLLHLSAALLLGAKVFYSFDVRQRRAATAEGLKVIPARNPVAT